MAQVTRGHDAAPGLAGPVDREGEQPRRAAEADQRTAPVVMRILGRAWGLVALRSFAAFLLLWLLASTWVSSPLQLPSPISVFGALWGLLLSGELLQHALISTSRLVVSLIVAAGLAIPLGFMMALNRELNAFVDPIVELLRPISGIAWIPLALFIFGVGGTLPVFIMVYVAFFPILLNTIDGVRSIERRLIDAARTMGVGRSGRLFYVAAPAALPSIMVGFRIAFASAWAAIIAAELIGSPNGLGFAIEWYRQLLMSPKVFAFIMVIGVVGYMCDLGLRALQRKLTPWSEGTGLGT